MKKDLTCDALTLELLKEISKLTQDEKKLLLRMWEEQICAESISQK